MKGFRKLTGFISFVLAVGLSTGFLAPTFAFAASSKPIKWTVIGSWPLVAVEMKEQLVPWVQAINERLKGRLEISISGPEAVAPTEQLKAVRDGIFDANYTNPAYHAGDLGLGMGLDIFFATSKEMRAAGAYEVMAEAYKKTQGVYYLGNFRNGAGYQIMMRNKCIQKADLTGFKLRTNPFYDGLVHGLGGSTVGIPGSELYTSLEKGVVDGATWAAIGSIDFKWYEVAQYQIRPTFGQNSSSLLVNVDSWNKLPKDLQDEVTKITRELEESTHNKLKGLWKEEEAEVLRRGQKFCELPPEESKKFLDTFYNQTWVFVNKLSPQYTPRLKEAVEKVKASR